jgi:hypothetical protein
MSKEEREHAKVVGFDVALALAVLYCVMEVALDAYCTVTGCRRSFALPSWPYLVAMTLFAAPFTLGVMQATAVWQAIADRIRGRSKSDDPADYRGT